MVALDIADLGQTMQNQHAHLKPNNILDSTTFISHGEWWC